jgi:pimeloyl-ACP methyl ester carboxylesterase
MPADAAPPTLLFLAGPPAGPAMFDDVIRRVGSGVAESVVHAGSPDDGWRERGEALAGRIAGRIVVAHGLAVPAAIAAALRTPPAGLVLSNGPITRLDPVTRVLAAAAATPPGRRALRAAMRPAPWLRVLASSAALRRTVVNPYVMDRDTVVALCGPLVATPEGRRAVVSYVRSLGEGLPEARALTCPTLLVWGDDDALYPASEADFLEASLSRVEHRAVEGGRFFHPVERPWDLADRVAAWHPMQA